MLGLMQNWPLTVDKIIDHAARLQWHVEVVGRQANGSIRTTMFSEIGWRARQFSNGCCDLWVAPALQEGSWIGDLI